MKLIPLTQGKTAKVGNRDFDWLSRWSWYAIRCKRVSRDIWYAARKEKLPDGKREIVLMHRVILAVSRKQRVDHRDGDGLNNQPGNIRVATALQNNWNKIKQPSGTSQFRGVHRWRKKWRARIRVNRKPIEVGSFESEIEAAKAYNKAAVKFYGDFAKLNQIIEQPK